MLGAAAVQACLEPQGLIGSLAGVCTAEAKTSMWELPLELDMMGFTDAKIAQMADKAVEERCGGWRHYGVIVHSSNKCQASLCEEGLAYRSQ